MKRCIEEQGDDWRELVSKLFNQPRRRRVQLSVLVGRLCDETLNRGDVDGVYTIYSLISVVLKHRLIQINVDRLCSFLHNNVV